MNPLPTAQSVHGWQFSFRRLEYRRGRRYSGTNEAAMVAVIMSSRVTPVLYVKIGCPWCDEVEEYLDARGLPYRKVVVSGNPQAMREMVNLSGQSKAPTMDWDGDVLADFGVDELIPFLCDKGLA